MMTRAEMVRSSIYRLHDLTPVQVSFLLDDNHRFQMTCAGRRSRKTLIGKRKVLKRSCRAPGNYFHAAPTQQQAKKIFWTDLKRYTRPIRVGYSDSELWVRLINGSTIHVLGLDKPERIEGQVWHGGHITEMGNVKPGAWRENIRPVFSDTNGWCIIDGVPEGRAGDYYDMALYACGGTIPERDESIKGSIGINPEDPEWAYYHWYSADVLPPHEIDAARRTYDERTFQQEYEGSFGVAGGQAYYAFGNHNLDHHLVRNMDAPVYIGMDFNVDPMTAVLCYVNRDARMVYQWGEIFLQNSNTYEIADEICRRLHVPDGHGIVIIPDASAASSSTNSTVSDTSILMRRGFSVMHKPCNPQQRNRLAAVNSLLRAADGTVRYKVNPKACPMTIRDFNRVELLPDGRIDKRNEIKGIGHITDALGYLINYYFPVIESRVGTL